MSASDAVRVIRQALREGKSSLLETEAKRVCEAYGLTVPPSRLATSESKAVELARELEYPLVAKVVSPDILHKTDLGGVILGISNEAGVAGAYETIVRSVREMSPSARTHGVLLERMEPEGIEVIVGATNDPQFGKVVAFGLGGIFVETYADVAFRLVPITRSDAESMVKEIRGAAVFAGLRGGKRVDPEVIFNLIIAVSKMADELDEVDQIDLNPVILRENQATVVDARFLLTRESRSKRKRPPTASLERFFNAQSVAVIGASSTPGKIGHEILRNTAQYGYKGRVYPVNPSVASVLGLKCYPSVSSIPEVPDLAVFVLPAKLTPSILEECGRKGVRNVVIISGGFKEIGGHAARIEDEVVSTARKYGIRIVGPNCIGVLSTRNGLDTFFQSHERMLRPPAGRVSFLTQSGTVGCTILEWAAEQEVGISKFVSYGNRSDVDEADLVEYLGSDPETGILGIYVEGLDDGRALYEAASRISKAKPIVILKAGATSSGSSAAKSHTGALAGSHKVALAAFKQSGMITVENIQELFDVVKTLDRQPAPSTDGVVMVTNGAGPVVMASDTFEELGVQIAKLAPATIDALGESLPSYCYVTDTTIDLTGSATSSDYDTALRIAAKDPSVGILLVFFVFQDTPIDEGIQEVMPRIAKLGKPVLCCAAGGPYTRKQVRTLEANRIPVFESGERIAVAAHALIQRWHLARA